jgi:hypothetical protein
MNCKDNLTAIHPVDLCIQQDDLTCFRRSSAQLQSLDTYYSISRVLSKVTSTDITRVLGIYSLEICLLGS